MTFTLRRIGVLKSAIMGGIGYALLSLVFVPFFLFFALMAPFASDMGMHDEWTMGPAFVLMLPLIYGIFGFISMGLGAAIYNLIALMVGGLDLELEQADGMQRDVTAPPPPPTY